MIKNKIKRLNALACIAAFVLLAAALATTAGTFAAYRSSATGTATAQVAKWSVTVSGGADERFSLRESAPTGIYDLSVTSVSEVAIAYDVEVYWEGIWPDGVTLSLDNGASVTPPSSAKSYTFANAGQLSPNGGTNHHAIAITATEFDTTSSLTDIRVNIVASQID